MDEVLYIVIGIAIGYIATVIYGVLRILYGGWRL